MLGREYIMTLVGEILKRERAADAEKFPQAQRIISALEQKIEAIPPFTPERIDAVKAEAADNAAKKAATPAHDFFYKGSA